MVTHHQLPTNNCAILVLSCDKYSDLWEPFFSQFFTYWDASLFPVYFGTNTKSFHDKRIKNIHATSTLDWSSDLLALLQQIKEEYIFLWLEDIFPTEKVDTDRFNQAFSFMKQHNAHHIHISPVIKPDNIINSEFGSYQTGAPYRVTGPGFWKKETLKTLLIPGENPWKFEIMGSYRSSYQEGYYTVMKPIFPFIRVVDKGRIMREAYYYCKANDIKLDTDNRKIVSVGQQIQSDVRSFLFQLVLAFPWKYRLSFMEILRRLVVSY